MDPSGSRSQLMCPAISMKVFTTPKPGLMVLAKRTVPYCSPNIDVVAQFLGFELQNVNVPSMIPAKGKGHSILTSQFFPQKEHFKCHRVLLGIQMRLKKSPCLLPRKPPLHTCIVHSRGPISWGEQHKVTPWQAWAIFHKCNNSEQQGWSRISLLKGWIRRTQYQIRNIIPKCHSLTHKTLTASLNPFCPNNSQILSHGPTRLLNTHNSQTIFLVRSLIFSYAIPHMEYVSQGTPTPRRETLFCPPLVRPTSMTWI